MTYPRVISAVGITAVGTVLIVALVQHGMYLEIATLVALSALVLALGYAFGYHDGVTHPMGRMRDEMASVATCVGGPMDGIELPVPPFEADCVLFTEGHPEGSYRLDGDRLLWEEHE